MTGYKSKVAMTVAYGMLDGVFSSLPVENLIVSEGTVYGSKYHTVYPVGGNWKIMEQWCIDTLGLTVGSIWADALDGVGEPGQRWYMNNRKFWFREEKDLTMFILKWSS